MDTFDSIPLSAISHGREYGDVLDRFRKAYDNAMNVARQTQKPNDELVADALMCAVYRIYLLGIEDEMNYKEVGGV